MRNVYLTLKAGVVIFLLLIGRLALAQPVITSFSPAAGAVGTTVTITGSGFSATPGDNIVFFGADQAVVQLASATILTVQVPTGATYAPVTVTANQLTGYSRIPFILTFANGDAAFNANSFRSKIDLSRTIQGRDVAIVDLNGDGKPDIITSNGSTVVSVIRNKQNELPTLVTSFTPTSGDRGTQVTIFGQHFTNAYAVRFGGVLADSMAVLSDTVIIAKVGAGATGDVAVITPDGTFVKAGFTFTGDSTSVPDTTVRKNPVITSFSPTSGRQGTMVTIWGQHFTDAFIVKFGNIRAQSFAVLADTVITAIVDSGATGDVIVASPYGVAHKAGFTFIRDTTPVCDTPRIVSFSPVHGVKGTPVTIFGAHFNGATAVRFGGIPADSIVLYSDTVIIALVDTGATGDISVITPCGMATSPGFIFFPDSTGSPDSLITRMDVGHTNSLANLNSVALYPNPASGYVVWRQPATNHNTRLQVIDLYGRIIKTITLGKNTTQTIIPVSGLPSGMYKLSWVDGKNRLTKSLLIK